VYYNYNHLKNSIATTPTSTSTSSRSLQVSATSCSSRLLGAAAAANTLPRWYLVPLSSKRGVRLSLTTAVTRAPTVTVLSSSSFTETPARQHSTRRARRRTFHHHLHLHLGHAGQHGQHVPVLAVVEAAQRLAPLLVAQRAQRRAGLYVALLRTNQSSPAGGPSRARLPSSAPTAAAPPR